MARDFLAVSGKQLLLYVHKKENLFLHWNIYIATSVPIERVFSGGTDLITSKRCSLSTDVVRACMCLKSWWKGKD